MTTKPPLTINDMVGRTFVSVTGNVGDELMTFKEANGDRWLFQHEQDCCESVAIEDIAGDLDDLVGQPLVLADESSSDELDGKKAEQHGHESATWTFYRFATHKGFVTVRWLGTSNGYYGESVSLVAPDGARS